MKKWFGKGGQYFIGSWEGNETTDGPDWKEHPPVLKYCDHKDNRSPFEGNCNSNRCPLGKK